MKILSYILKNLFYQQFLYSVISTKHLIKEQNFIKHSKVMVSILNQPRIRDYQIPAWIERYLMIKGIKTDPSASAMLTEYLGTDLTKL